IAGDSFAIDDAGARAQACQRLNNQREATGEIVARTAIEPHPLAVLAGNDAEAVMLDLVQPLAAGRQLIGFGWEARRDEPGREGTLQHAERNRIGQGRLQRLESRPCFFARIVGHDAPFAPVRYDKSPARLAPHNRAGRGAFAIRVLPDLCPGIGSKGLEIKPLWTVSSFS